MCVTVFAFFTYSLLREGVLTRTGRGGTICAANFSSLKIPLHATVYASNACRILRQRTSAFRLVIETACPMSWYVALAKLHICNCCRRSSWQRGSQLPKRPLLLNSLRFGVAAAGLRPTHVVLRPR